MSSFTVDDIPDLEKTMNPKEEPIGVVHVPLDELNAAITQAFAKGRTAGLEEGAKVLERFFFHGQYPTQLVEELAAAIRSLKDD